MNSFAQKYPAFAALLQLAATIAQDAAVQGESLVSKLESLANVAGPMIAFIPQASALSAELAQLKASPADIESAAEALVDDLDFSSDKAKAIIAAAFPVAESLVALIAPVQALIAVI
jgi:hypothetical protein